MQHLRLPRTGARCAIFRSCAGLQRRRPSKFTPPASPLAGRSLQARGVDVTGFFYVQCDGRTTYGKNGCLVSFISLRSFLTRQPYKKMRQAYIVDAVRSPMGRGRSTSVFAELHPVELLSQVIKGLVERNRLDPGLVDDVLIGCVSQG